MKQKSKLFTSMLLAGMIFSFGASAQTPAKPTADLMPPATTSAAIQPLAPLEGETHPPLNVSPDKSELVRLDREASSVIVGNPSHIAVLLDSPRLAVVIPRASGATYFSVLDKDGNVIMQRHVVVGAAKKNYVRVRRSCSNAPDDANCQPTSVYFCPDMCHEIGSGNGEEGSAGTTSTTATE